MLMKTVQRICYTDVATLNHGPVAAVFVLILEWNEAKGPDWDVRVHISQTASSYNGCCCYTSLANAAELSQR